MFPGGSCLTCSVGRRPAFIFLKKPDFPFVKPALLGHVAAQFTLPVDIAHSSFYQYHHRLVSAPWQGLLKINRAYRISFFSHRLSLM